MTIGWQEHPFEWIEGRRMGVYREFHQGPWKWFTSVVEMTPHSDGGTTLVHRIRILPANLVGTMAARLEVGLKSRKAAKKRCIATSMPCSSGEIRENWLTRSRTRITCRTKGGRKLEQRLQTWSSNGEPSRSWSKGWGNTWP